MSMREYLIQGKEYSLEDLRNQKQSCSRRIDETSDGADEYEALDRLVKRYAKTGKLNENYFEVRIRATGRIGSAPWFPEQAREDSYNKGLLSRFWTRFALSETEEELREYGEQFRRFSDEKGFHEASLERMRAHYAEQLQGIRSGRVKPETYELRSELVKPKTYEQRSETVKEGAPEQQSASGSISADQILAEYCDQAIVYLRSFGYRITAAAAAQYEVRSLSCHHETPFFYEEGTVRCYTPLGLVLFWQRIADERGLEAEDGLEDLGFVVDGREQEYEKLLRERNMPAYVGHDDAGAAYLCVLKQHSEEVNAILGRLGAHLEEDYTDVYSFRSSREATFDSNYYHNLDNMLEK